MTPAETTDADLMLALQQGDRSAYEALYTRWGGRVFHFLVRRTGSRSAAEDANQETWLRVYRFRARYDPKRRFSAWLYTIAANAGYDAREPDFESFDWEPPTHDQHHLRDTIVRALHALDPDDRRLVLLSAEGFTSPEIADMVDMKPSAVRMRIKRVRARMLETVEGVP